MDVPVDYGKLVEFVLSIKNIAMKLTNEDINEIRQSVKTGKIVKLKENSD
ncbi:hypothetical protein HYS31_06940 [Candidatus Woesearchaeota archaeon]|nr:hypothetical protein [Candidatus Woesearchaeota archaeon]